MIGQLGEGERHFSGVPVRVAEALHHKSVSEARLVGRRQVNHRKSRECARAGEVGGQRYVTQNFGGTFQWTKERLNCRGGYSIPTSDPPVRKAQ